MWGLPNMTEGYSGSDITVVAQEALMEPLRQAFQVNSFCSCVTYAVTDVGVPSYSIAVLAPAGDFLFCASETTQWVIKPLIHAIDCKCCL